MQTRTNYTAVGGFFIGLCILGIALILWLSSGLSWQKYITYLIYMKESVSGLNIDAPVEYNGVNVGNVKRIELNKSDPHIVEVYLNIKQNTPMTEGTLATVTTRGLTGVAFIALQDHGEDLRPLKIKKGDNYPIIKTSPSLFVRLDTLLSRLTENVDTLSRSLQTLLNPHNQLSVQHILKQLDQITLSMAKEEQAFRIIMKNSQTASANLLPLMQNMQTTLTLFQQQTLPNMYQTFTNVDEFTNQANELTQMIKQNPTAAWRGERKIILGPGEKQ